MLQCIHQAGLTAEPRKCALAKREVQYLGHILGRGVIRPQKDKIEAIRDCPQPLTKKHIRSFLGLAGWYRWFVPNFACKAAHLNDLTRKSGQRLVAFISHKLFPRETRYSEMGVPSFPQPA